MESDDIIAEVERLQNLVLTLETKKARPDESLGQAHGLSFMKGEQLFDNNNDSNLTPRSARSVLPYFVDLFPDIYKRGGHVNRVKQRMSRERKKRTLIRLEALLGEFWEFCKDEDLGDPNFKVGDFSKISLEKPCDKIICILTRYLETKRIEKSGSSESTSVIQSDPFVFPPLDLVDLEERLSDVEELASGLQRVLLGEDFSSLSGKRPRLMTSPACGVGLSVGDDDVKMRVMELLEEFRRPVTVLELRRSFARPHHHPVSQLNAILYKLLELRVVRHHSPESGKCKPRWSRVKETNSDEGLSLSEANALEGVGVSSCTTSTFFV